VSVSPNVTGNSKLPRGAVTMGAKAEGIPDLAWILRPGDRGGVDGGGLGSNPFHQGIAKESGDPDVVAAAMSKPDVVLRLPAGSEGPYREHADLPMDLAGDGPKHRPKKSRAKSKEQGPPGFFLGDFASGALVRVDKQQRTIGQSEPARRFRAVPALMDRGYRYRRATNWTRSC
jgi:hypothetical protein